VGDAPVSAELRATAAASFVLLRNESDLLPLHASALRRVAVVGPNAEVARTLGGGSALVLPSYTVGPLEGLQTALGPDVEIGHAEGVRSMQRLAPAPLHRLRLPDRDEPGVTVRFLAADGSVLRVEDRSAASFTWLGRYGKGLPMADVHTVEVRTRLRAVADGDHEIGCSAIGHVVLEVDGHRVLDTVLALPADADPVEGLIRPPQAWATLPLLAEAEVPVVLRVEPAGDVSITAIQLTLEPPRGDPAVELDAAVALAAEADVAVVVVGTTEEVESEGFDRDSLALPGRQDELVRRVAAANPRTVVVVNAGAPVLLPWATSVPAVLMTWFPGQEFGNALADVLLGRAEPGGRLPTAWPADENAPLPSVRPTDGVLRYDESIHVGQRGYDHAGIAPAFPFGHGLGYTTWRYLAVDADVDAAPDRGDTTLHVRLQNVGNRPGREVVQVYAADRDVLRRLVGFAVVDVDAGEEATATVVVPARQLQHWDGATGSWTTDPGAVHFEVGPSAAAPQLSITVVIGKGA
jgi:beta-glucosidase